MLALALVSLLRVYPFWAQANPPATESQKGPLQVQFDGLRKAVERTESAATNRDSNVFHSNIPLARFKLRKAVAQSQSPFEGEAKARESLDEAAEALERYDAGKVGFEGETGHLERAYITQNDNTAQPFYVYVPEDYSPGRRWPLIVFLHGYVPYTSIIDPWVLYEEHERIAADAGALLLTPYGRRNTDFQGVGEVDVLASIEEMKRFYSVDPDRIYLCGPSMGGYGTWTIALRHPGMFAACAPMCGQTDMFVWWPWPHLTAPRFKQFLGEWDNPIDLAPNAVGQSCFLQHGEFDRLIPIEQSYMMRWEMDRLGTPIEYYEHKDADHFIYQHELCFQKAFPWLVQHKLDRWPRHVRLKSYSYRYDTAFWLRILEYQRWGQPGQIEATVEGNRISLTSQNISHVQLTLSKELLDIGRPVTVVCGGKEVHSGVPKGEAITVKLAEPLTPQKPGAIRKRKGLCGPVEDVFNGPFVVVPGTAGSKEQTQELMDHATKWCQEWDAFADGVPPVMLDTDVDENTVAERSLVLFGTPETNQVIAGIADRLPVKFTHDGYTLGGRTYSGPDLGLALCYPNPKNPDRYVLIYAGEDPGTKLGINHKHDLLPDYLIFRVGDENRYDDTYPHLCAGFLDLNWEFDPALMDAEAPTADPYFGSAALVRDATLTRPVARVINGFADPLRVNIDDGEEAVIQPGDSIERTLEPGRHLFTGVCPDGITRTEQRLMVPQFRYEWRVPALFPAGFR
jgi:poly(3-hydroxybutyrate) depolymerase